MAFHAKHGSEEDWIDDELDLNEDVLDEMFGDSDDAVKKPRHGAVASDELQTDEDESEEDDFDGKEFSEAELDQDDILGTLDSDDPEATGSSLQAS